MTKETQLILYNITSKSALKSLHEIRKIEIIESVNVKNRVQEIDEYQSYW